MIRRLVVVIMLASLVLAFAAASPGLPVNLLALRGTSETFRSINREGARAAAEAVSRAFLMFAMVERVDYERARRYGEEAMGFLGIMENRYRRMLELTKDLELLDGALRRVAFVQAEMELNVPTSGPLRDTWRILTAMRTQDVVDKIILAEVRDLRSETNEFLKVLQGGQAVAIEGSAARAYDRWVIALVRWRYVSAVYRKAGQ